MNFNWSFCCCWSWWHCWWACWWICWWICRL